MKFGPDAKLINYSTVITALHNKHGVHFVESKEFTDIISVNDPFTVLKFLFLIAYEAQDIHPESIDDTYGIIPLIEAVLDNTWEKLKTVIDGENYTWWYFAAKSLLDQYSIPYTKDDLVKFINKSKLNVEQAKAYSDLYVDRLASALLNLEKAGNPWSKKNPNGDILLIEMMEFERNQLVGLLRGALQDGKTPDISSIILFSDQLDNPSWWKDVKKLTWEYVESKITAGV